MRAAAERGEVGAVIKAVRVGTGEGVSRRGRMRGDGGGSCGRAVARESGARAGARRAAPLSFFCPGALCTHITHAQPPMALTKQEFLDRLARFWDLACDYGKV